MTDFDQFERRLGTALRSDADQSVDPFEAEPIARAAIAGTPPARRFGRGRGMTLLAAAALLLVGGALAGSGLLRLPSVVPPAPAPSLGVIATASPDATSPSPSESAAPSASPIPVAGPGGVWIPTGSMGTPRTCGSDGCFGGGHSAVRLLDGRVLVVGGNGDESEPSTAELYDPASGTWSATGDMLHHLGGTAVTLLHDGTVLVANDQEGAEVYDPATGTWSATGKMVFGGGSTATLLRDSKVLVTGGLNDNGATELYDPDSGTWSATGTMVTPRYHHRATLLPDGRVLVAGGEVPPDKAIDSAEVYDPVTGAWTAIANMQAPHSHVMATVLRDGKVLVVSCCESEVYDPATGTWTAHDMPTEFGQPRAVLSDDTVLLAGGAGGPDACTAAALYDPHAWSLTTASSMHRCGYTSSFTLLLDGTVLVAGGSDCNGDGECGSTGATELYIPAGVSLPLLPAFSSPPPFVIPSPTPRPTPLPPADGPVPPNARTWKVTVDNQSSEPATLFVAGGEEGGLRLVGSATPNVVPAGATTQVTFHFPADEDGSIYVSPRPGEGGSLVNADQIGIPGKIVITADGQVGWLSP